MTDTGADMKARAREHHDEHFANINTGYMDWAISFAVKEVARAVEEERMACASIADKLANSPHFQIVNPKQRMTIQETSAAIAKAIHSRSQVKGEG